MPKSGWPVCQPTRGTLGKMVLVALMTVVTFVGWMGDTSLGASSPTPSEPLVVYSGRAEALVDKLIQRFTEQTGIPVSVRYGGTAELAATLLEEGRNSPADVFFAQDGGALGAIAHAGRFQQLPQGLLEQVDPALRSSEGLWVGTSGRARVVAYNTDLVTPEELPDSIWGFIDPKWRGRIGWAPGNASFQAFVTALRVMEGEDRAREWLKGILANRPRAYRNNVLIVDAVGRGEISIGLVNHYYLFRFLAERGESFPVRHHHTQRDAGSLINVAGVGILDTARHPEAALSFIEFLLSEEAQRYFAEETREYPLAHTDTIALHPLVRPLSDIDAPHVDVDDLEDLQSTLDMLLEVGAL